MLHLYALADHPARLTAAAGIDGSQLRTAQIGGALDAVVSDVSPHGVPANEAAILTHAAVVDELAGVNEALLPARFGPGYQGEDALAQAIESREVQIREALECVRGCVELGLRIFDGDVAANGSNGSSGREYMLGRLQEVQTAERIAAEVHETLAVTARESTSRVLASPQLLLSAAYLLPREELESFRSALDETERRHPRLTFVCTGPWPPYSFALIDGDRA